MADVDSTPARATSDDWAVQTADTIERLVDTVRSNTSDRLVSVARLVVFGLLAAILGTIGLVFLINFIVRILDSYIPSGVWVVYLILGGIFTLLGLYLWSRAWKRPSNER
jgi:Putative Actinobacterial Holin-X, holin superfamily III